MARQAHDRENLLRDATALLPRVQLRLTIDEEQKEVFAGFRASNALSIYFDADPVYHFNSHHQLRRAYIDNVPIKADRQRLISWQTRRTERAVELVPHVLSSSEQLQIAKDLFTHFETLKKVLDSSHYSCIGQVPEDGDGVELLRQWLMQYKGFAIASSPRVR